MMGDDFSKYEQMRDQGVDKLEIYRVGIADGLDSIKLIRMIRTVFDNTSLRDAKELDLIARDIAPSLEEWNQRLSAEWEAGIADPDSEVWKLLRELCAEKLDPLTNTPICNAQALYSYNIMTKLA